MVLPAASMAFAPIWATPAVGFDAPELGPADNLAFMRLDDVHVGRFADNARRRLGDPCQHVLDQPRDAQGADLFVIGQRVVHRDLEIAIAKHLGERQRDRDERFHVCCAAPVEPVVPPGYRVGIDRPFLAGHGNDVGVAGQNDAGAVRRSDRGEQVGLLARVVIGKVGFDPKFGQIFANEFDQRQVRPVACRIERHQAVDQLQTDEL